MTESENPDYAEPDVFNEPGEQGEGEGRRCGFVAVIGAPNAGKSTLVNRLVGAKVSIVTHKVQTTRARVRGVAVEGDAQVIFVDTPGIFRPKRKLDRAMVSAAWEGIDGAEVVLLIVDAGAELGGERGKAGAARKTVEDNAAIVEALKDKKVKTTLVLNKIDRVSRPELLELITRLSPGLEVDETFLVSASNGDGMRDLMDHLVKRMPEGPWMYPEDQLSDITDRMMAAEVTREKIYLRLHDELPYESTVETEIWKQGPKGDIRIEQTIYVSREGHKPIVLGKGGQTLKTIGEKARTELEEILGSRVHLFLHVKVREGWTEENARLRAMGLDASGH